MSKIVFSFLFILVLINLKVEAEDSCSDDCLTQTYCISSEGSGVCSENNLVTAKFSVIQDFYKYDYVQLILKGYNVAPEDVKTMTLSFDRPPDSPNQYICHKESQGAATAKFTNGVSTIVAGSTYYKDNELYCNWTFNINDNIWPSLNSKPIDLIKDEYQAIHLINQNIKKIQVAGDTSQLPIYHAQYLKCCNKVHSNDEVLLTFDKVNNQIRYRFYYFEETVSQVTFILTSKDGIKLQLDFNAWEKAKATISDGSKSGSVTGQLISPMLVYNGIFSWSTPFVLSDSTISIDLSKTVFDLEIQVDGNKVYTEKDISLKSSSFLFESSTILIVLTVLFQIFFIH